MGLAMIAQASAVRMTGTKKGAAASVAIARRAGMSVRATSNAKPPPISAANSALVMANSSVLSATRANPGAVNASWNHWNVGCPGVPGAPLQNAKYTRIAVG